VVVDEFGSTAGLVTLNDLVAGLAGEMPEVGDPEGPVAVRRDDGSWLVDGSLPMEELRELAAVHEEPGGSEGYRTAAGFAFARFGRLPRAGEHFTAGDWRVEVVDMDANRIDKLLLTPLPPATPERDGG
jgi:putative hemolysin